MGPRRAIAALAAATLLLASACGPAAAPPSPSPSAPAAPSPPATSPSVPPGGSATPAPTIGPEPPPLDDLAWVAAGTNATGRIRSALLPLPDGDALLVGADNTCTPGGAPPESMTTERFDEATGSWSAGPALGHPRQGHVAVVLHDGSVLIAGGVDDQQAGDPSDDAARLRSTLRLDPGADAWVDAAPLQAGRTGAVGVALADGRVLVAGGSDTAMEPWPQHASVELFDPGEGTWSPTASLREARADARGVRLADGRVLVVGGWISTPQPDDPWIRTRLASAEIYDPTIDTWSPAGSLATAPEGFALVALPDGGALALGGRATVGEEERVLANVERFDPATGAWEPQETMLTAAHDRAVAVLRDGRVVAAGGHVTLPVRKPVRIPARLTGAVEVFDPATGRWAAGPSLPSPRSNAAVLVLGDGSLLLAAGISEAENMLDTPSCPSTAGQAYRLVAASR